MALTLVTSDLIHGLDYSKLTGTIPTWNQNTTGNAATATLAAGATILATARNIGGVSFNGSAAIDLPGVNAAGNQPTSGNAGSVTNGVYTVGDQTIAGVKTFSSSVTVNGPRYLVQRSNDDSSIAFANNASGSPSSHTWAVGLNYSNSNAFTIAYASSGIPSLESSKLVMTTGGNVGIGTTSPSAKLKVEGNAATNGLSIKSAGNGGTYPFMVTWSGGSEGDAFCVNDSLNVGIGTTSPSAKLQIHTAINAGNPEVAAFLVNKSTTINTEVRLAFAAHTNDIISTGRYSYISAKNTSGSNGQDLIFATNATGASATPKLTITSGGVVEIGGIATVTPALLSVRKNGTCIEYGHGNNNGRYEGTLGAFGSAGYPYIGFSTSCDNSANTFTTRGWKGNVINSNDQGDLIFSQATNANAGTQTLAERMRISSGGIVLIGTTNADVGGSVQGIRLGNDGRAMFAIDTGSLPHYISPVGADRRNNSGDGNMFSMWRQGIFKGAMGITGNDIVFKTGNNSSDAERMRISSGGNVLLGGLTSLPSSSVFGSAFWNITGGRQILRQSTSITSSASLQQFFNPNGQVGSINVSGSSTSYSTSSDYRLKENVTLITDALSRLNQLKPSRFNFIADADRTVDGFIAHEVQDIIPEAISGEKDAVSEDGTPYYQGIDQSKIVPLLTAAIQEQQAQIELLKQEVELLKQ